MQSPIREKLAGRFDLEMICPYEPGKPVDEVRRELGLTRIIKLASNENPLGSSPCVTETLNRSDLSLHQYPDHDGWHLRAALAARLGVGPDQVVLGAGSAELMRLIANAYLATGDEAIVADLCFPVYENVTRIAGARPVVVPLDAALDYDLERILAAVTSQTRVVFLATPNNPTGRAIPFAELDAFIERLPERVLCVVDLAYWEYVERGPGDDPVALLARRENVVLLHTFSKVYGLAGLRIGYAVGHPAVASWIGRLRIPFSTNTAAQVAAEVALADQGHVQRTVALNRSARALLVEEAARFGYRAQPSCANFVLLEGPLEAEVVFQRLLRCGIVVRPMRHPRLCHCVRVTTGTMEHTREFLDCLEDLVAAQSAGRRLGEVEVEHERQAVASSHADRPELLIVDEDRAYVEFLRDIFAEDFGVLVATTSEEGLNLFRRHAPRFAIVDQCMPRMSGLELLARMKALDPSTVRIMVSGFEDAAAVTRALNEELGCRFYAKPVDPVQLRRDVLALRDRLIADGCCTLPSGFLGC